MIRLERGAGSAALRKLMARGVEELAAGRQIVIMPEGTRQAPDAPPAYKPGAAALYGTLGCACLPFAVNSGLFWPRRKFLRYPRHHRPGIPAADPRRPAPQGLPGTSCRPTSKPPPPSCVAEGREAVQIIEQILDSDAHFAILSPPGVTEVAHAGPSRSLFSIPSRTRSGT